MNKSQFFLELQSYNAEDRRAIGLFRKRGRSVKSIQNKYRKATKEMIDRWANEVDSDGTSKNLCTSF